MAQHKRNFLQFIEPEYEYAKEVNPAAFRVKFQKFMNECLEEIPDDGSPKNGYAYNAHMGNFARLLDSAKDELVKAVLAFHATKGSCKEGEK